MFTVALDPREAEFVLARGWGRVDGVRWRVSLEGWTGKVENDGRVTVRCDNPSEELLRIPEVWPKGAEVCQDS